MPSPFGDIVNNLGLGDTERWTAGTGISHEDRALPDFELGQFMPILGLVIKRIMADQRKKVQMEEFYGIPESEFAEMEDYQNPTKRGATPMFKERAFDPEAKLRRGQRWQGMKNTPLGRGDYKPVREWDMREF